MNPEILTLEPVAWILRGGLLVAAMLLVGAMLRRRSAAWLAFYWRFGMVVMLAMAGLTLSGWKATAGWPESPQESDIEVPMAAEVIQVVTLPTTDAGLGARPADQAAPPVSRTMPIPWPRVVWILWGLGATVVIGRWIGALVRRCLLAQGSAKWKPDDSWLALLHDLAPGSRPPRLLIHPTAGVPCAWGIWRPTILLPAAAPHWSLEHRRLVLAHELTHLHRRDPLWQAISVFVLAVHWANPLAWLAVRKWRLAEEQAADDAALAQAEPSTYAALLVACARSNPSPFQPPATMTPHFSMAHPSTVPQRVERILDATQDRQRPGFIRRCASVVALTVAGLACFMLTPGLAAPGDTVPPKSVPEADSPAPAKIEPQPAEPIHIEDKLNSLIIPNIQLEQATIAEAVEFLRMKSQELDIGTTDPKHKGVNFILRLPTGGGMPKVASLNLTNVPLGIAVRAVADQAGLWVRVEPFAVILAPPGDDNELYTKVFRVPPDFLSLAVGGGVNPDGTLKPRAGAAEILKQAGIPFPEQATAFFSGAFSTLTVRNTPSNLDYVASFIESIASKPPKMINLRAEFYRLPKADVLAIVDELESTLDATAVVKRLRAESAGPEKIKLLSAPSLQTRSGQRARVRSGRGQSEKSLEPAGLAAETAAAVDDFQGSHFEATPILGPDGHTLDVSAQFGYGAPAHASGQRATTGILTTSTTLYVGQPRLVGTLSGGEEDDSGILVFLKATLASHQ